MARPPGPLRRFIELFNSEEFWESHEALEDAWRAAGSEFYHGLILYASAFVHAQRGNRHGIVAQLDKAERALRGYPASYLGIDLAELRAHADRCRHVVADHPDAGPEEWVALIPFPRLHLDAERVSGDEVELRGV